MPQSFYELDVWKKGYKLVLQVYNVTKDFPSVEKYGLIDQMRRSANSIIANIAESQGRYAYNDGIRILYLARGEIFETRSHLKVAEGLGYVPQAEFNIMDKDYEGLLIGLNLYIRHLARSRTNVQLTNSGLLT